MAQEKVLKAGYIAKARAVSGLVKPELPIAAGICVVAGEIIASGSIPPVSTGLLGFSAGFFISGAAMISNDYFDLAVDRVNQPQRPLPSGRLSVPEVMLLIALFSIAGFAAAGLISAFALAIAVVMWVVAVLYNWRYKETGLPGNMMVALSVAMTFICGGVAAGESFNAVLWTFATLAFIFDLGEEIANGAMDMDGDARRSVQSIARQRGKLYALRISGLLFTLMVVISFLPVVMGWLESVYLVIFVPMGLAILYFAGKLLASQTIAEGRRKTRQLYLTMIFFIVSFVAISAL
jgi:geranylgeranylglycerol-phosphate geranylgeranyltransferase